MTKEKIEEMIAESMALKNTLPSDLINAACNLIIDCYKKGKKVLVCGNGGSAADAQHMAGELINKFKIDRAPLPCLALTTDTSVITAIGNDFGYEHVFKKQVEALGQEGDILVAISTSGNSINVVRAIEAAKEKGIKVLGLLGRDGGKIAKMCNLSIIIKSNNTPRIQESHILIIHIICEIVENWMVNKNKGS